MAGSSLQTVASYDDAPYQQQFSASVIAFSEQGVALAQTLFYPTGGGQPGDSGSLTLPNGQEVRVTGTVRDVENRNLIWHQVESSDEFANGMTVTGKLDWQRRYQHMKMHTCLHLLCAVLPAPVTGCSIGDEKGRLDFDLPEMTTTKEAIAEQLNQLITAAHPVRTSLISEEDYALALKLTKSQDVVPPVFNGAVRVIEIPGIDMQPCGGTHVKNTSEIGQVVVDKIEKKSKHNPRVTLRFLVA
jgi:Ser-tRNA(Ala) deacylase AlaX